MWCRVVMAFVLTLTACASESPDGRDDVAIGAGKADGTGFSPCELAAVVEHLNGGVSAEELRDQGLHGRAADALVAHRDGEDGEPGTADDDAFDDAAEVDGVSWVGPVAMRALVAIVEYRCAAPAQCEDAPVLGVAGETASDEIGATFTWSNGWSIAEPITVRVPDDLEGLTIAVVSGEAETGITRVTLDDRVMLDLERDDPGLEQINSPFFHVPTTVGTITFPMDPSSRLEAGCLTITPVALDEIEQARVVFVSRRFPRGGAIDVNAIIVGESAIDEAQIRTALQSTDAVYAQAGDIGVGLVDVHPLEWPEIYVDDEGPGLHALRAAFVGEDEARLNIYFVQDFTEAGTLGFAPGIPGPSGLHGTAGSGLVISLDSHLDDEGRLDLTAMGETIAHEIGHQLGLFHTTESDGSGHDILDDTAECPAERDADMDGEVSAEECLDGGASNVMFWTSGDLRQTDLSPTQTEILASSPVAR